MVSFRVEQSLEPNGRYGPNEEYEHGLVVLLVRRDSGKRGPRAAKRILPRTVG